MMCVSVGHTVVPVVGEELAKIRKDFKGHTKDIIQLMPGRWLYPAVFTNYADRYYNFKWRESDVMVMTWPKCGTTWMQEIIWNMKNNPNLDNPRATDMLFARSPFIEYDILLEGLNYDPPGPGDPMVQALKSYCPEANPSQGLCLQLAEQSPAPRIIKTHLPFSLHSPHLLNSAKVVFVVRNPKDAIISYCHHVRLFKHQSFIGTLEDFVQYFMQDNLQFGSYSLMVKEAWEKRGHPNLHIVFYENLKTDIGNELRKLNNFIGTNLSETQLQNVVKWTSLEAMRGRTNEDKVAGSAKYNTQVLEKDGGFIRKGIVGDWREKFSPELNAELNQWIEKYIDPIGINLKYS
ncbi:unnamed protein product, partial [Meganyctiphanes norvegica]